MSEPNVSEGLQLIFLRHAEGLRGFACGLLAGDLALADDVVQEVFLVVSRRASDFRPDGDFQAWIRGIARNKVREALRQRAGTGKEFSADLIETLAAEAPDELDWEAERKLLKQCLADLAPTARKITELHYLDGLHPSLISQQVRWTLNAVHVALSRIRRQLRGCIDRRLARNSP